MKRKFYRGAIAVSFIGVLILGLPINWLDAQFDRPLPAEITVQSVYEIPAGSTSRQMLKQWSAGQLSDAAIAVWLKLHPDLVLIQSGYYEIETGMSMKDMLEKAVKGEVMQLTVTLVEGQTWSQWLAQLQQTPALDTSDLRLPANIPNPIEGWLMPDTYAYLINQPVQNLISKAHREMVAFLQSEWVNRQAGLPFDSQYEALILASIVEKETGLAQERPKIAGVFINRLNEGMRLQTDPTVIYGLGQGFNGNLTKAHLRQKTPYNTYRINGLPPTPIAMPSKDAIIAVLQPTATDALYFVARGDGSHEFSTTLQAHNKAVRRYQLGKP